MKPSIQPVPQNYIKSFLALPVTHSSLFGQDFKKSSDKVIKEQAKVIAPATFRQYSSRGYPLDQRFRSGHSAKPYYSNQSDSTSHSSFRYQNRGRPSEASN